MSLTFFFNLPLLEQLEFQGGLFCPFFFFFLQGQGVVSTWSEFWKHAFFIFYLSFFVKFFFPFTACQQIFKFHYIVLVSI